MNRPPEKSAPPRLQPGTERKSELNDEADNSPNIAGRKADLPEFLHHMLANPPKHGEGVHNWLFRAARQLHAHRPPEEICGLLAEAVAGCGRPVPESEISDAVQNSREVAWRPGARRGAPGAPINWTGGPMTAKWPDPDPVEIERIAAADPGAMAAMAASSPWQIRRPPLDAKPLLAWLFPGDPLLCSGMITARCVSTEPRRSLDACVYRAALIVPSCMSAPTGRTKMGKRSKRCLDNTGPRRYLVTEFDAGDRDTQAAIIRYLAKFAPLAMVVDSAGKSLHAWWPCRGQDEETVRKFFRLAVELGADSATWSRCQMVRMPLGLREACPSRVQHVPYFNPWNTLLMKGGAA